MNSYQFNANYLFTITNFMMTLRNLILSTFIIGLFACNPHVKNKHIDKTQAVTSKLGSFTTNQLYPENSIGVVYLDTIKDKNYFLTIRFPNFNLPESILARDKYNYIKDIPIKIPLQTIILFDEDGELLTLKNVSSCISKLWCENDGGIQYEPTYILTIEKIKFKRILKQKNPKILGKISCFALLNYNAYQCKTFYPEYGNEKENVIIRGRFFVDYSSYSYKVVIGNYNCTTFGNWECTENGNKDAQFPKSKLD